MTRRKRNGSQETWRRTMAAVHARDGGICGICGEPVDIAQRDGGPSAPSLDHVIPWSKGGPDSRANLRITHIACNRDRGAA